MSRPKLVVGNWKMYTTRAEAVALAQGVTAGNPTGPLTRVVVCPPFVWLDTVRSVIGSSHVELGAQDCGGYDGFAARTGQVAPQMLVEAGCRYVIVGHSERRHGLAETADLIRGKVRWGLNTGLRVILCVGETLDERQAGTTEQVIVSQLQSLIGPDASKFDNLVIAYEPVWAIGTGEVATPEQAQEVHAFIRQQIAQMFGGNRAVAVHILYGGSVKPDNAAVLMSLPDVDGALVGGASLKADQFLAIVAAAG